MKKQYAATQVCEITLSRDEVEQIVVENLLARGGDPSYDFSRDHPIVLHEPDGTMIIRFVQAGVVARERERWLSLKPAPTEAEIREILRKRELAIEPKQ